MDQNGNPYELVSETDGMVDEVTYTAAQQNTFGYGEMSRNDYTDSYFSGNNQEKSMAQSLDTMYKTGDGMAANSYDYKYNMDIVSTQENFDLGDGNSVEMDTSAE
jgi:hypothetical protein